MNKKIGQVLNALPCFICFFLAFLPTTSAAIYYLYQLNTIAVALAVIISAGASFFFSTIIRKSKEQEKAASRLVVKISWKEVAIITLFIILAAYSFYLVISGSSEKSIISPWQTVSSNIFLSYGLTAAILFILLSLKNLNQQIKIWSLRLFYFLSFSACLLVYKIGYGFDPFIHQATMEFIAEHGWINPKNPYYIGQYGLVISLYKISGISIQLINTWLLPALAAFLLPTSVLRFLQDKEKSAASFLPALAILFVGFSPLIMTAPQNLGYLFLLLAIFSGLRSKSQFLSAAFAIAALSIHPLAGLPAIAFVIFSFWHRYLAKRKMGPIFLAAAFLFAALSIPVALYAGGGEGLSFANILTAIKSLFGDIFAFDLAGRESWSLNLAYLHYFNRALIFILAVIGSYFLIKKTDPGTHSKLRPAYLAAASLCLAYLASASIKFGEVIGYEQGDYAGRIIVMICIFLLPLILLGLKRVIGEISKKNIVIKTVWIIAGSSILAASFYSSYPRLDRYHNSRGYSTGINDTKAVELIEQDANGQSYAVLANQQISAAALKEFGFNRYLKTDDGEIYFYPIPTGGSLYKHYLNAVYQTPSKDNMASAMDLTKTNSIYLVINKYWNRSAELINEAKVSSDAWHDINGEVFIFKYVR